VILEVGMQKGPVDGKQRKQTEGSGPDGKQRKQTARRGLPQTANRESRL
jgi:hypothetical protein